MKEHDIIALLKKYTNDECTDDEKAQIESWYLVQHPDGIQGLTADEFRFYLASIGRDLPLLLPVKKRSVKLWPSIAATAAVIIIMGVALYFYSGKQQQPVIPQTIYANDVAPGQVGATLTLGDGKKIRLSDVANGELVEEPGVRISKSAKGRLVYEIKAFPSASNKMNTLSTGRGEVYEVRLPDGSLVYLNAASSLTYSTSLLEKGKRYVRLQGEGYFEIAKDKAHPFVVETVKQRVEVLGTHFNINAYNDEPDTKTTLLEGSVKVLSASGTKDTMLKPGQQALVNKTTTVISVDPEMATAWKNGDFVLRGDDFKALMRKIARWYNVEVIFDEEAPLDLSLGGLVSRDKSLIAVLKVIELTGKVHFKVEGRRVTVMR